MRRLRAGLIALNANLLAEDGGGRGDGGRAAGHQLAGHVAEARQLRRHRAAHHPAVAHARRRPQTCEFLLSC